MSCYGTGEVVTEQGAVSCPDCFGDGKPLGRGAKVEWRLRELDKQLGQENSDVQWLIHELRRCREALLQVLTLCQDADEGDALAREIKFRANEALGLWDEETAPK